MAGTLKVDSINADSNLTLKIANTAVAFIDSNGLRPSSGNVSLDATGTTGVRSPAANTLVLYTAGTEDVRITSNGDVGVGISSPEEKFHISGSGSLYAKVESTGTQAGIKFETTTAGTSEYGILADSTEALRFYDFKNGSEPVRFNRYGIGLGGTTPSSGMGIAFPATQSASSNANTLDDYEEGTFTPTAIGASTAGTTTYTAQNGYYTKIGRQVNVTLLVAWSALTGTGNLSIQGLPFTIANLTQNYPVGAVSTDNLNWSGGTTIVAEGALNSTNLILLCLADDAGVTAQQCVNESASARVTLTYFTAT